jgi:glycogen debranching enzyme
LRQIASERFIAPLTAHLQTAGIGHVSEIADGDPPHTPRGCPFQAWSLGELIRLQHILSADKSGISNEPSRRAVHAAMARHRA